VAATHTTSEDSTRVRPHLQKPAEDEAVTVLTPRIWPSAAKPSSPSMTPTQPFIVTRRVAQQPLTAAQAVPHSCSGVRATRAACSCCNTYVIRAASIRPSRLLAAAPTAAARARHAARKSSMARSCCTASTGSARGCQSGRATCSRLTCSRAHVLTCSPHAAESPMAAGPRTTRTGVAVVPTRPARVAGSSPAALWPAWVARSPSSGDSRRPSTGLTKRTASASRSTGRAGPHDGAAGRGQLAVRPLRRRDGCVRRAGCRGHPALPEPLALGLPGVPRPAAPADRAQPRLRRRAPPHGRSRRPDAGRRVAPDLRALRAPDPIGRGDDWPHQRAAPGGRPRRRAESANAPVPDRGGGGPALGRPRTRTATHSDGHAPDR
jgi:hypothetical protein